MHKNNKKSDNVLTQNIYEMLTNCATFSACVLLYSLEKNQAVVEAQR